MSTMRITIDAVSPIVLSGDTDLVTPLGISSYQEPAIVTSIQYGGSSPYLHGSTALSWKREQALLNFTVMPTAAASEAAARTLIVALRAAVEQMGFNVTVNVDGRGNEVWRCDPGSVTPTGPRTWVDIKTHKTEWNVSIPCYPVSS